MCLNNLKICCLFIATILLTGCIDREVTIILNPDGSGILEYLEHFDRADEEMRDNIKKQMASEQMSSPLDEDRLEKLLPTPNFKVIWYTEDKQQLRRKIIVTFKDINELLAREQSAAFNITGLDFHLNQNALDFRFSGKPGKTPDKNPKAPLKDMAPPRFTLTIVNGETREKITYFQEGTGNAIPDWNASLPFKSAGLRRVAMKTLFKNFPVVQAKIPKIWSGAWHVNQGQISRSSLNLEMTVSFEQEPDTTYVNWKNPVLLKGSFDNEYAAEFTQMSSKNGAFTDKYGKATPGSFNYQMNLKKPDHPVSQLEQTIVRFVVEKSEIKEIKKFNRPEKGVTIEIDGVVYEIEDLSDTSISIKITKKLMRFSKLFQLTRHGNRVELKRGNRSTSGDTESISFALVEPPGESTFFVQAHSGVHPIYLDLTIGPLDLTPQTRSE
ncbi:MAG: hypothetical protein K8S13_05410 [Desulfobacula sp.]|uniref:hypothetical protein n=1 Tax=Desulfobacula sp. TaxID=2593537 RepID=UPI0025C3D392|nr:hypothetical protein [Desulfobacula sp.]MCD4719284.1 hypothetical protein [Desulfobacula sp.]